MTEPDLMSDVLDVEVADGAVNVVDARQVEKRKSKAQRRTERDAGDLVTVMSTMRGRRWMWAHLERCGIRRLSYQPGAHALDTAFREGERNIGNRLFAALLDACPEQYAVMVKEHSEGEYDAE